MKKHKILIAPVEVAGFGAALQNGFSKLGIKADLGWLSEHRFSYKSTVLNGPLWMAARHLNSWATANGRFGRVIALLPNLLLRWMLLFLCLGKYREFVFLGGVSFTNTAFEYALMRLMGKRVVVVFLGSDARPPYLNGKYSGKGVLQQLVMLFATWTIRRRVRRAEKWSWACVNALATSHFHRKKFVDWYFMGFPAPSVSDCAPATTGQHPLRVVHAPSNLKIKGTNEIRSAVEAVRSQGIDFEFEEFSGVPNNEVISEICRSDLVVDQAYSDVPIPGFATEAASLGRPAVVGSYLSGIDGDYFKALPTIPTIFCRPENLAETLYNSLSDPEALSQQGKRAREFIDSCWNSKAVAKRYLKLLAGEWDEIQFSDPYKNGNVWGLGLSAQASSNLIANYVNRFGGSALMLGHNPALRSAVLQHGSNGTKTDA